MATISRFFGILIAVFLRGETGKHNRPHIHVFAAEYAAVIAINDGKVLGGKLPVPVHRVVRQFVRLRRAELMIAWDDVQAGKKPAHVAPVKVR